MRISDLSEARLSAAFLSPFYRLDSLPDWWKVVATAVAACVQFVRRDAFGGALFLVFIIGVVDFFLGIRAARAQGEKYDPAKAHRGALGKISGVLLCMLVRLVEFWISGLGLVNTNGALGTAIAISLFAVDLKSIAHHRETFGAAPIPVLSSVLDYFQALARSRVPAAPVAPPADASPVRSLDKVQERAP